MKPILETETRTRLEVSRAGFEIASEGAPISPLATHLTWEHADERPPQIERRVLAG